MLDRGYIVYRKAIITTQGIEEPEKTEKAVSRVAKKLEKELGAGKQVQRGRGGQEECILQGMSISKASR